MDVVVRYWDDEANKVQTRQFSSVFLHSTKTIDLFKLLNGLIEAVGNQNLFKIIQVSIDGPNVNFSMLKTLKLEFSQANPQKKCSTRHWQLWS